MTDWMTAFAGGPRYIAGQGAQWGFNKIHLPGGIPHNVVMKFCDCNPADALNVCVSQ